MNNRDIFVIAAGVVMLALAVAIVVYKAVRSHASEEAEKKRVSRLLHRYAGPRGFRVIDHAALVSEGISGWADHILIGHFGVLLVYDLCWAGGFYGKPDEEKWTLSIPNKGRYQIDNPMRAGAKCAGRVITLLKGAGIKVTVECAVVITGITKDTISYIKSEDVVKVKQFHKYLKRAKFGQDRDINVEAAAGVLTKALKQEPQF